MSTGDTTRSKAAAASAVPESEDPPFLWFVINQCWKTGDPITVEEESCLSIRGGQNQKNPLVSPAELESFPWPSLSQLCGRQRAGSHSSLTQHQVYFPFETHLKIKRITDGCEEMSNEETAFRRLLGPVRKLSEPFMPSLVSSKRLNHFYIWTASVEEGEK